MQTKPLFSILEKELKKKQFNKKNEIVFSSFNMK